MTRRGLVLGALGAGASAIAYPCFYEPRWLETTERRVHLAHAPFRNPIRLLHLADLHASLVVPLSLIQHAITLGLSQAPDLICLTGDFITFRHDFDSDRKSTRLNSSHTVISYAVFCLKKKKTSISSARIKQH